MNSATTIIPFDTFTIYYYVGSWYHEQEGDKEILCKVCPERDEIATPSARNDTKAEGSP